MIRVRAAVLTAIVPSVVVTALTFAPPARAAASAPSLTLAQRVEAQRALEQVTWAHRIWPADNPGPKPALSDVIPDQVLRIRAEEGARKSNALASLWREPITRAQLQAEIDRMVRDTKDAALLHEMFDALGNDPELIAECIARPLLADRLVRSWFAQDERFQGTLRRDVVRRLEAKPTIDEIRQLGGEITEAIWTLDAAEAAAGTDENGAALTLTPNKPAEPGSFPLGVRDWAAMQSSLRTLYGRAAGEPLPTGRFSRLREDEQTLSVVYVRQAGPDTVKTVTVSWPKAGFESWWEGERDRFSADVAAAPSIAPGTAAAPVYNIPESVASCTNDTWSLSVYGAPDPRTDHTAVWTGTEMIVWGGISWDETNTGGRYNPATDTWTQTALTLSTPPIRTDHSAVWTGTEMIVWGGVGPVGPLGDGGRYNPTTNAWTAVSNTNAPAIRGRHVAVWTGSRMIIWGGEAGTTTRNTGGVYNPATDTWTATSLTNAPAPRTQVTGVWTGTVMVVWGGLDASEFNTGGRYNPTTDTWTATTTTGAPQARYRQSAIWTGTRMVIWGGINGFSRLNTGGIYDPGADSWVATSTGANVPLGRASHTAVWTGSKMIIWGGTNGAGSLFTGGVWDAATNAWTGATNLVNAPPERVDHTAIWTGSRMVVWGGAGSGDVVGAGGRYDPVTDSWTPVTTGAGVLSPRIGHSDVWTGSEMIVWGGWDGLNLNSGGRYNPATDTWSFMSTLNAPNPRLSAMQVWDGVRFLVWGGTSTPAFSYMATGGRYEPATDTWTPISQVGNPSGRVFGAAVWTGTRLVIWGGRNSSTYFQTGGRYDPLTNAWLTTNIGGATPSGRSVYQNAVWTGAEMIVWGGYDGSVRVNTGAKYSPFNDTWVVLSPGAGTPSAREKNGAVWTGTDLIIFGGFSGTSALNNGGRYNVAGNTWTAISTINGPSAREFPAMVWTGDKVLVWGGDNVSAALSNGNAYDPQSNSWTALANLNSPVPQNAPSAVWSGSQMMVLGGSSQIGLYCTCASPVVFFRDQDGDGFGSSSTSSPFCGPPPSGYTNNSTDCNDSNGAIWGKPGETTALKLVFPGTLNWTAPATGGTSAGMLYDTLRSGNPSNFNASTTCVETDNGPNTTALDAAVPAAGQLFSYLIRAQNACPSNNIGTLGFNSSAVERTGRTCP